LLALDVFSYEAAEKIGGSSGADISDPGTILEERKKTVQNLDPDAYIHTWIRPMRS
jgi:hypothetical protein